MSFNHLKTHFILQKSIRVEIWQKNNQKNSTESSIHGFNNHQFWFGRIKVFFYADKWLFLQAESVGLGERLFLVQQKGPFHNEIWSCQWQKHALV